MTNSALDYTKKINSVYTQVSSNTNWELFTSSLSAWEAMLLSLKNAKENIDFEQYIFTPDAIGKKFLEIFKQKAKEGLKVRVLLDEVGSFYLFRSNIPDELRKEGVEIHFFNSIIPWNPNRDSFWYFRDHRKLMIIDSKIGFTGGACISEEMREWRESHVKVKGHVVEEMKESFNHLWEKSYKKTSFYKKSRMSKIDSDFSYISNFPIPGKRFMYRELLNKIKGAKKEILLTTPYFLPNYNLLRALKKAVKKKVEVKILIPEKPNHILADIGSKTFFTECLNAKIRIFRYKNMIHSKTGVIDGQWSTIGSLNLDNLSLTYNFEGNLVSTNKDFAFAIKEQFLKDLNFATELKIEDWKRRGLASRFFELLVWPIRKFL